MMVFQGSVDFVWTQVMVAGMPESTARSLIRWQSLVQIGILAQHGWSQNELDHISKVSSRDDYKNPIDEVVLLY
ncbi:hypothetical protein OAM69_02355 [bacterium]|nr:hypothetical protein [bacterium]